MADFKQWDPSRLAVSFKGVPITGFVTGTFIDVERDTDAYSKATGAMGDVTRVKNLDHGGKVTFTLMAASASNDSLSTFALADERFGLGKGALFVKHIDGTTLIHAANAWVQKLAKAEFAAEASEREWVIDCAELEMFLGGSLI